MKDFQHEGLVTLTLNRVILHTVVHHSSTSTYMSNFIEIEKMCGRSVRMYVRTHGLTFETHFISDKIAVSQPIGQLSDVSSLVRCHECLRLETARPRLRQ